MKLTATLVALTAIAAQAPAMAQEAPSPPPVDESLLPYTDTSDLVTLPDGRQLHFVCMGEGAPTIILNAPAAMAASAWGSIQPELAKITRTCAWDPPGFGLSDGVDIDQTVESTTADLEAGLIAAGIGGPYIVAGHSAGAYESLLFADRNPDMTVGLLLLDPSIPGQAELISRMVPALADYGPAENPLVTMLRQCASDISAGTVQLGDGSACYSYPPSFPPAFANMLAENAAGDAQLFASAADIISSFNDNSALIINPTRNYGDMLVTVLTALDRAMPPDVPAELREQNAVFDEEFYRQHEALARLSTRGLNIRIPSANHNVHVSAPWAVIEQADAMVGQLRREGGQ